jgi:CRISPR system Cascade subunit CasA
MAFFKEQKVDGGKLAAQASTLFWQLCERHFQHLVDACEPDEQGAEQRRQLRLTFAGYVQQAYDHFCPKETARQLDAWAKCRPNNSKYLRQEA